MVRLRVGCTVSILGALVVLCSAPGAQAERRGFSYEPPSVTTPPVTADQPAPVESPSADTAEAPAPVERPFLYLVDPTLPRPMHVVASYTAGYAATDAATRPLAATANRSGLVNELRVEGALHERFAPFVSGLLAPPARGEHSARTALRAGARVLDALRALCRSGSGVVVRPAAAADGRAGFRAGCARPCTTRPGVRRVPVLSRRGSAGRPVREKEG